MTVILAGSLVTGSEALLAAQTLKTHRAMRLLLDYPHPQAVKTTITRKRITTVVEPGIRRAPIKVSAACDCFLFINTVIGETDSMEAMKVLKSRRIWKKLPQLFLEALAEKLESKHRAIEFVELCERTQILQNNLLRFDLGDPQFALGQLSATLTSYANHVAELTRFKDARLGLELAILLKPMHVPAWTSMALVSFHTNDCPSAVFLGR